MGFGAGFLGELGRDWLALGEGHRVRRMTEHAKKRDDAPRGHIETFTDKAGSINRRFFDLLWPGASSFAVADALGARITAAQVRMYRRGARPLPQWLRDLGLARAQAIASAANDAPRGNGRAAGYGNWRAAQAARRHAQGTTR